MKNSKLVNTEEKICAYCGKKYLKKTIRTRGHLIPSGIRGVNTVTCSKECSKKYNLGRKGDNLKK